MFYDKYQYGICVGLEESGCLRAKTHAELDRNISYRNSARRQWGTLRNTNVIEQAQREKLFAIFDELDQLRSYIKLVVGYNFIYVYSNDIFVLEKIANLPDVRFINSVQSIVDRPRDVILKTNPKFKYRSYFKDKTLDEEQRDRLLAFFDTRKSIYSITNTVKKHLSRYRVYYLQRHFFVEHNDPKDITMLSLVVPGIIRKTMPIQAK